MRVSAPMVGNDATEDTAAELAGMLPNGFDMVWLVPSGEPEPMFRSNLITLNMPLNRMEFLNTVRMLAANGAEQSRPRKTVRSKEDEALLRGAKERLMARHHLSEREAHKLLQRRSMESGMRILEVARLIAEEE